MSDKKIRIFAIFIILIITIVMSDLYFTRGRYVRYSFYDVTGYQYEDIKMFKSDNEKDKTNYLKMYIYGYFKPYNHIPSDEPKQKITFSDGNGTEIITMYQYSNNIIKIFRDNQHKYYQYILRE